MAKSGNEQLISLKKSFDALKDDVKNRENKYEEKIVQLQKELDKERNKEVENKGFSKKLLASIECDDLPSGAKEATSTCKKKVEEFLSSYGKNNFFEVSPIIDDGGFATLKKVADEKSLNIPQSEIERLTRLSNIGLGKDRALSGGQLVSEIIGEDAFISYSPQSVVKSKKRGFVIRVYE